MFSPKTYLNRCINKGEGFIMEKSLNVLSKIKSSGIFANDMSSSLHEGVAYFTTVKIVSLYLSYTFCLS